MLTGSVPAKKVMKLSWKENSNIMEEKKLGLPSVIATGAGLIVATSCLLAIGQGDAAIGTSYIFSMMIACAFNILTALTVCELNAVMPRLSGGLAQYSLACMGPFVTIIAMVGGYLISLTLIGSVEGSMFGNTMGMVFPQIHIPNFCYGILLMGILILLNLKGLDLFAKVQDIVSYGLILSLLIMGIIGWCKAGTGKVVVQDTSFYAGIGSIVNQIGLAFYMFVGCEFIVSIGSHVKNPRKNIPIGMIASLLIVFFMQAVCVFGFANYVPFSTLGTVSAPHIVYGIALLGNVGKYWMAIVSILAVISTANTIISSLSYVMYGMAKINMLPSVFRKKNRYGAPYPGILVIGGAMMILNATGLTSANAVSTFMLVASVLWIVVYLLLHVDVLLLRKRMPSVPRTFKVPGGPLLPLLGIAGDLMMIYGIGGTWAIRLKVYGICIAVWALLGIYAYGWIRKVMKRPLFKPVPIKEVMAMENELYFTFHKQKDKKTEAVAETL